jgi:2-oxoglutarate dehydrogenase E2 component (dihydrolipoamide succinyltransferase)
MAEFKVELPKMGESVAEATITTWLKEVGDVIEEDEPIVEIATDKVDSEVPAPCSGILKKVLFNEGDVVEVGSVFAIIDSEAIAVSESQDTPTLEPTISNEEIEGKVEQEILEPLSITDKIEIQNNLNNSSKFYSPLVKSIASKEGISFDELETINGTGSNQRITKKDILNYVSSGKKNKYIRSYC